MRVECGPANLSSAINEVAGMRVQDVMTTDVVTVTPDTPLKDAARLLVERRISGVPVVIETKVVGMLSESDLVELERGDFDPSPGIFLSRDRTHDAHPEASTVGDVMTTPAITVMPAWTVAGAAALMIDNSVNRLPVVRAGDLEGIITRVDVVRAFARTDAAIEREIGASIEFQQNVVLDDSPVTVTVEEGEAVLAGTVRSRSQAERLRTVAANVPGVVAVHSELAWSDGNGSPGR